VVEYPALQAQSPEFKPQSHKKKKEERKKIIMELKNSYQPVVL
jgi:hypothetical protein